MSVVVNRTGNAFGEVEVSYRVVGLTATSGDDFIASEGLLVLAAGSRGVSVAIPVTNDALPEGSETFRVELLEVTGGAGIRAGARSATITILPSDYINGQFGFKTPSRTVGEPASGTTVEGFIVEVGHVTQCARP